MITPEERIKELLDKDSDLLPAGQVCYTCRQRAVITAYTVYYKQSDQIWNYGLCNDCADKFKEMKEAK